MDTLIELFEATLRDVYHAEKQIAKALEKMGRKTTSEPLAEAFRTHLDQTHGHIERLEKVFEFIGAPAKGKKCDAIQGLIEEAEGLIKKAKDHTVRDAAVLAAAQAIEHYEISRYATLKAWAHKLGISEAAQLLDETLREVKEADEKLSELAESEINVKAESDSYKADDGDAETRGAAVPRQKKSKRDTTEKHSSE